MQRAGSAAFFLPMPEPRTCWQGPFAMPPTPRRWAFWRGWVLRELLPRPNSAARTCWLCPGQSPLPLGLVLDGFWPVGISRFGLLGLKADEPFLSPKGEAFWARQYGGNIWIYPGWPLDLSAKRQELAAAGYSFFAHMQENPPAALLDLKRQGLFNWEGALL